MKDEDAANVFVVAKYGPHWARLRTIETPGSEDGRDVQPALIGRQYVTERDSAPVQYSGIV